MKSYLSLIPLSARVRRKQNRLTLMCIILAVFLVTSIFSLADIWIKTEKESLISRHGNYHIIVHDLAENDAGLIAKRGDVAAASWYGEINPSGSSEYTVNGKNTILYGAEEAYVYEIRNYPVEGSYPQNSGEIMLSAKAKELFGISAGSRIELSTPAGGFHYTVSGFCEDDAILNDMIDGVCAYLVMTALNQIGGANKEDCPPVFYIQFAGSARVKKAISDLKEEYHLEDGNVEENTVILGLSGASASQTMTGLYPAAAALFILILIAGVLMISGCMNSNVAQRTKFFGMLRCVGASRRQIMHIVRMEALNWCKTAIPIGCGLGVLVTWVLSIVLKNFVKGEFESFAFKLSITGLAFGAAVGIITVLLAAHSPAKRAAKISPVAAVSGGSDAGKKIFHTADMKVFKVETVLGIHHAVSAKKNLILMTLSFAFLIILFFGFYACLDFARNLIPSLNSYTPDMSIVSSENTNSVDRSLKGEISQIPGVKQVYGNMFAIGTPAGINGEEGTVDLISYDEYMLDWSKRSVAGGDLSKITADSNYALTIFNKDSLLDVGDKIQIGDTELEIACVLSQGVWGDAKAAVICSEETFTRITGEENYIILNATFTKGADEKTVAAIRGFAGENTVNDQRENNKQSKSSYWVFRLAAYGFLAIISLITIFNIMNSISMSVTARIKQYGAMRAVGMSVRQLTRMVAAEAAAYAVCGLVLGGVFGLLLHRFLIKKLIIAYFGGVWKIPAEPVVMILLIVVFSCAAAVYAPSKRIRNLAITETINEL